MQRGHRSLAAFFGLVFVTCVGSVQAQSSSVAYTTKVLSNEAAAGHREGAAFAGSPGYLFVGAPHANGGAPGSGAVYFSLNGVQAQKIDSIDPNCLDFGASLALTQDILAVGAPASSNGDGMVKVETNSMGFWVEYATVKAPVDAWSVGANFGYAVAVTPTQLIVGAPNAGNQIAGPPGPGAVYFFDDTGSGYAFNHREVGALNRTGLGTSLALAGTRVVAGKPNDPAFASVPGSVLVYNFNGTWSFEVELFGTATFFDQFGTDVGFNGTRLVVGAPSDGSPTGSRPGRVHVFTRNGANWTSDGVLRPANGATGDGFGTRVALETSGSTNRVLIAAPGSDFAGTDSGSVHVFVRNATQWNNVLAEFAAPETVAGDRFGGDVTFGGDKACVGAPFRGQETGALYVFGVTTPKIFCTPQVNSAGCTPSMSFIGQPTAAPTVPFTLSATQLLNQKPGLLFYGRNGSQSVPMLGGILCVRSPIKRTPPQSTGGSPTGADCTGTFQFDFASWAASGMDPAILPGVRFDAQIWTRDPSSAGGSNLTDAVEFTWLP